MEAFENSVQQLALPLLKIFLVASSFSPSSSLSAALPTLKEPRSYLCEAQADGLPSLLTNYQDWELLPVDTALAYSASLLYSYNSATAFGDVCAYTE